MQIKTVKVGSLQTNCYIIIDDESREALVVDPGDEADKILPEIEGLKIAAIVITHGHPDHFGALDELKKMSKAPVLMHPADHWFFMPDKEMHAGDEINAGKLSFKVLETPGHTEGSVCLYRDGYLFSGDTLFADCHGRTDLPGGSSKKMADSLYKLSKLPGETKVFPGHAEETTIALEKERGTLG